MELNLLRICRSFWNTNKNLQSNRKQEIYVSYTEAAFSCVDRRVQATKFRDKSWSPWVPPGDWTEAEKKQRNPTQGVDYCDKLDKNLDYLKLKLWNHLAPLGFGCLVSVAYCGYEDN